MEWAGRVLLTRVRGFSRLRLDHQHDADDAYHQIKSTHTYPRVGTVPYGKGVKGVQVATRSFHPSGCTKGEEPKKYSSRYQKHTNTAHRDTLAMHPFFLFFHIRSTDHAEPSTKVVPCTSAGSGFLKSCGQDGIWSCTETSHSGFSQPST